MLAALKPKDWLFPLAESTRNWQKREGSSSQQRHRYLFHFSCLLLEMFLYSNKIDFVR